MPDASKDLACELFEQLLEPVVGQTAASRPPAKSARLELSDIDSNAATVPGSTPMTEPPATSTTLMGGGR